MGLSGKLWTEPELPLSPHPPMQNMHCCSQQLKQSHASHFSILHLTVLSRAFSNTAAVFFFFSMLLSLSAAAASPLDVSQTNYFTGFLHSTLTVTPKADSL